jgi:predicted nucleic acid-binding protein
MADGYCLDAGALIAVERGDRKLRSLLRDALARGVVVDIPCTVVAQVWSGSGPHQARVAALLGADGVDQPALDAMTARAVGELCGRTNTSHVVAAHVALHATARDLAVVTSDPDDIAALAPHVPLVRI